MSKFSVQDVAAQAGVTVNDLKKTYTVKDIHNGLANTVCADSWKLIGSHLELTDGEINAIDQQFNQVEEKRAEVLKKVKESRLSDANFLLLVKVLLARNSAQKALEVCKQLKQSLSADDRPDGDHEDKDDSSGGPNKQGGGHEHKGDSSGAQFSMDMPLESFVIYLIERGLAIKKDQQIIQEEGISPKVLMEMTDEDFKKFFTFGGQTVLKKLQLELREGSGCKRIVPDGGAKDILPSVGQEHLTTQSLSWCIDAFLETPSIAAGHSSDDTLSAVAQKNLLWPRGKKEITVKFLNIIPQWAYHDGWLNPELIIFWAREWNKKGKIPEFVEVRGKREAADIRVKFIEAGPSHSKIGVKAQDVPQEEPTMFLNLSTGGDIYKKYVVVHEFGHALGLDHEHQRGEFWKSIGPYIDIQKMKNDPDLQGNFQWFEDQTFFDKSRRFTCYDPESIMHYWFKAEWLRGDYADLEKVKNDPNLSNYVKKALEGIHLRSNEELPVVPSRLDYELLEDWFGVEVEDGVAYSPAVPQQRKRRVDVDQSEPTGLKKSARPKLHELDLIEWNGKTVRVISDCADNWQKVALRLYFDSTEGIEQEHRQATNACTAMFNIWLKGKKGLRTPTTWATVVEVLSEANLVNLARDLDSILSD